CRPLLWCCFLCSSRSRRRARLVLFPYTTLFRSLPPAVTSATRCSAMMMSPAVDDDRDDGVARLHRARRAAAGVNGRERSRRRRRSEEHTSELQSRENLVCRLLLGKKT